MKRRLLVISFINIALILAFALLPSSFISANPGNLVVNGDFSSPLTTGWTDQSGPFGSTASIVSQQLLLHSVSGSDAEVSQTIFTTQPNLTFKFDINPSYGQGSSIYYCVMLWKGNNLQGSCSWSGSSIPIGTWTTIDKYLPQWYKDTNGGADIPDYDRIVVWLRINNVCDATLDNVFLEIPAVSAAVPAVAPIETRTMPMTCYQVWVNKKGNFEFIFWYLYADSNWITIYDKDSKEVFSKNIPFDGPDFEIALPDGMYTVKTFTDNRDILQTFTIGKDANTPRHDLSDFVQE